MKHKILIITVAFAMLFYAGCSSKKGVPFTNLVQDVVVKITMRHPGSGVLYSTTDEKLINKFVSEMEHGGGDYYEIDPVGLVGSSVYRLFNAENTEIATIIFYEKGKIEINDKLYHVKADIEGILNPFFEEYLTDKNIVEE